MADLLHVAVLQREIEAAAERSGAEPQFPHLPLQQLMPELREHHTVEPRPLLIGRTRY